MPELPNLKIPTSFSEFVDLTIVTGSAVATAVGSFAQNAYTSLSGNKEVGCKRRHFSIASSLPYTLIA